MAINIYWLELNRILVAEYSGRATHADYMQVYDAVMGAYELGYEVGAITDLSSVTETAPDLVDMPSILKMMRHPNWRGAAVIMKQKGLLRPFVQALSAGLSVKLCDTHEQALAYLRSKLKTELPG
jgi:hypothetical protein